jgi:polyisoprenoid-binding protein YceI
MTVDVGSLARSGTLAGHWTLDPAASRAEFSSKHFWGTVTVRGSFGTLSGEGTIGADGMATGSIVIDAASLDTGQSKRDDHLRSKDFFHVKEHPRVVLTVQKATLGADGSLTGAGTFEAAGVSEPVTFTAAITDASAEALTLRAEITVDRSRFGMTWRPLKMTSLQATGTITARFTRDTAAA